MEHDEGAPLPDIVICELGRPDVHDAGPHDGGLLGGKSGLGQGDNRDFQNNAENYRSLSSHGGNMARDEYSVKANSPGLK